MEVACEKMTLEEQWRIKWGTHCLSDRQTLSH